MKIPHPEMLKGDQLETVTTLNGVKWGRTENFEIWESVSKTIAYD